MGRRLYVGNLPYSATEDQLTELFSRAGKVDNVRVMRDMATGRARGFAFVEMGTDEEAQKAISEFHEQQMDGRALVVNEARPKPEGGFGGGGGGGGGGGYRGGGGGGGGRSFDDGDFSGRPAERAALVSKSSQGRLAADTEKVGAIAPAFCSFLRSRLSPTAWPIRPPPSRRAG